MSKPTLYLMIGYPGAGKTTTTKILHGLTGATVLSSDDIRRKLFAMPTFTEHEHQQLYRHIDRELEALMKEQKNIIYDANLNRYRHRQDKYRQAEHHGYDVKLIWAKTPEQLAKSRRIHDASHYDLVPAHENPASMFERIVRTFEQPHPSEPYVEIDGTSITREIVKQLMAEQS